jgi:hypothetical protein
VDCQVLGGKHEFLVRRGPLLIGAFVVKRVDNHIALDGDGLVFVSVGKEHDPPAKAAYGRLAGLVQRRVGPDRQHAVGGLRFGLRLEHRQRLAEVPLGAARHGLQGGQQQADASKTLRDGRDSIRCHRLCPRTGLRRTEFNFRGVCVYPYSKRCPREN